MIELPEPPRLVVVDDETLLRPVFEVPAKYGSQLSFFRSISPAAAESAFVTYAKHCTGAEQIERLLAD